ncbi:MAG: hypothetical protein NTY64_24605 [Deltaproteobacteria bacterium]|nr:hypothetical protein [Deltaproteobacteria bacterium]
METERLDQDDLISRYIGTLSQDEVFPLISSPHAAKTRCNTITISGAYEGVASVVVDFAGIPPDMTFYVSDPHVLPFGQMTFNCKYSVPKEYGEITSDRVDLISPMAIEGSLEPDPKVWRGFFSPPYNRKLLFSERMEINLDNLPRLKPRAFIDRRTLERE